MMNGADNVLGLGTTTSVGAAAGKLPGVGRAASSGFADALRKSIEDVARLQQDASRAVEDLATGQSEDVASVMTAVEKSDLAFKTLLAIRAKLMDAYEELKSMQV
jgi:flagellar hook-basal body complex protein FliE